MVAASSGPCNTRAARSAARRRATTAERTCARHARKMRTYGLLPLALTLALALTLTLTLTLTLALAP